MILTVLYISFISILIFNLYTKMINETCQNHFLIKTIFNVLVASTSTSLVLSTNTTFIPVSSTSTIICTASQIFIDNSTIRGILWMPWSIFLQILVIIIHKSSIQVFCRNILRTNSYNKQLV